VSPRTRALDETVFGVDVHSGDVRGDAPSYALVVLEDGAGGSGAESGGVSIERDVVSHRKLRRLIASEEPALLATDNVYELAADADDLVRFLRELPDATRLVQVTGAEQPEPLSRVAKRHDVPYGKDPMQEAEASARLAAANVGQVVSAFTNTTRVKVARGRSTGGGGWSEDRYTRKIHGAVRRRSREVESALESAGLEFEKDVTEKYGGFSQALFEVEAGPDELPVGRERSGDVRIEIERERRDGIAFEPLAQRRDHVVVGVDPGTTTAVALVGLDGEVLDVLSTRTADSAAVIEWIVEHGRPILVAADVEPMPETVEKLRRSFDAAGWIPDSDLPIDTKQHRAPDHTYDNDHERDAVAAALSAYDDHEDQFGRIARKVPRDVDRGEVTGRVLAEETSVETVLAELRDDESGGGGGSGGDGAGGEHEPRELSDDEKRIRDLEVQVDRLQEHVSELESTVAEKEERIEELEADLQAARSRERQEVRETREVTRLKRRNEALQRDLDAKDEEIEGLEGKLERLKALWKLDHSNFADVEAEKRGLVPVKPVDEFTSSAIAAADETYGLAEDDVIYLRDAGGAGRSTAETLIEIGPRVVLLGNGNLSEIADAVLFQADIPVGPAEDVAMQEVDELAVARESDVEAVIDDWERRAREREREQTAEMVDQLISEHRAGDNEA
jgi:predicted RNase H-like nuclease (RuvC/YqgF family)